MILYTVSDGTNVFLKQINPDGTGSNNIATYPAATIAAVSPNPTKTNEYAFASIDTTAFPPTAKLYKGNVALNPATSTLLTSTVYQVIDDIQFSPDGNFILFKADTGTGFKLYRIPVGGGSAIPLSDVFEMSVNPVVGTHLVAVSQAVGALSEIFTIDYTNAASTQITTTGVNVFNPTWTRDGGTILFAADDGAGGNWNLFTVPSTGGTATQVPNPGNYFMAFGFFNEAKSKIGTIMFDGSGTLALEVQDSDGQNLTQLVSDNSLGVTCYWTDSNGRAVRVNLPHFQFGKRKFGHR